MPAPGEKLVVRVLSTSGGMNDRDRPWAVGQDQGVKYENIDRSKNGARQKIGGVKSYYAHQAKNPNGLAIASNPFVADSAVPEPDDGLWHVEATNLFLVRGNGASQQYPLSAGSPVDDLFSDNMLHTIIPGRYGSSPGLFVANAYQHPTSVTLGTDLFAMDLTPADATGYSQISTMRPVHIMWWQYRLWALHNLADSTNWKNGSDLNWSNLVPDTMNFPVANQIDIEPGLGGNGVALAAVRESDPSMIVFKKRAICEFYPRWGSSSKYIPAGENSLDTINSYVRTLSDRVGCAASKSIQHVPTKQGTDLVFLASDGHIRSLLRVEQDAAAGSGIPLSRSIEGTINRINMRAAHKATSCFIRDKYLVSVPLDGSTTNNAILAYDVLQGSWDTWSFNAADLATVPLFDNTKQRAYAYMQTSEQTTDTAYTGAAVLAFHIMRLDDEEETLGPGGTAIASEEQTAAFTFGDVSTRKRWSEFAIQADASSQATSTVVVTFSLDGEPYTTLGTVYIPQLTFAAGGKKRLYTRKLCLEDINPGYTIQFKYTESTESRLSVVYVECTARVVEAEFDNTTT